MREHVLPLVLKVATTDGDKHDARQFHPILKTRRGVLVIDEETGVGIFVDESKFAETNQRLASSRLTTLLSESHSVADWRRR